MLMTHGSLFHLHHPGNHQNHHISIQIVYIYHHYNESHFLSNQLYQNEVMMLILNPKLIPHRAKLANLLEQQKKSDCNNIMFLFITVLYS